MKNSVIFGETLTLFCPDGFHVMDSEEQKNIHFFGDSPGKCLSDPERHILISIGWKPIGGFLTLLIGVKDAARKMEADIRKAMQPYGYRMNGFAVKSVGNEKAEGFRYEYESQGIGMYGESYVVKHDRVLYYLNIYARRELIGESLDIWNQVLTSAKW